MIFPQLLDGGDSNAFPRQEFTYILLNRTSWDYVGGFFLPYFLYFQPQIQLLKDQLDAQKQNLDAQLQSLDAQLRSLEAQQQSQEIDIVRAGFELLQQRVDVKYAYAPDDPAFAEIECYAINAWKATAEGDTGKAKNLIAAAFERLATVGGPPTVGGFGGWDFVTKDGWDVDKDFNKCGTE